MLRQVKSLLIAALIITLLIVAITPTAAQQEGTVHTVQVGENLFRIALRYGYTVEYLAAINGIADPSAIYVGQTITIPNETSVLTTAIQPSTETPPDTTVTTTAAPTLDLGILPVTNVPATAVEPEPAPVYHTVQAGETLASIALLYNVTWPEIAAANGITDANTIFNNQQLVIPGATAPLAAATVPAVQPVASVQPAAPAPAAATGTQRTHVVQAGEHLAAIARTYNLSWPTIARANDITDPNQIYTGQTLIIPANDDGQGNYVQPNTFTPSAAPAPTVTGGKQIVVDVSDQRVYAYENGALVRSSLVSTGVSYYPTVIGDYSVYLKYESQTMSGPGYNLPGVPYVLYFYQGYSLHGTYWHSNFGTPMSHGCVNMMTPEAQWLYNWAPIGTPVHVQY